MPELCPKTTTGMAALGMEVMGTELTGTTGVVTIDLSVAMNITVLVSVITEEARDEQTRSYFLMPDTELPAQWQAAASMGTDYAFSGL